MQPAFILVSAYAEVQPIYFGREPPSAITEFAQLFPVLITRQNLTHRNSVPSSSSPCPSCTWSWEKVWCRVNRLYNCVPQTSYL